MIMAKFAALERIQSGREASSSAEAAEVMAAVEEGSRHGILTDTQLLEVFKQVRAGHTGFCGASPQPGSAAAQRPAALSRPDQNGRCMRAPSALLQTSIFNVKTALGDNEMLLSIDELLGQTFDRCVVRVVGLPWHRTLGGAGRDPARQDFLAREGFPSVGGPGMAPLPAGRAWPRLGMSPPLQRGFGGGLQ